MTENDIQRLDPLRVLGQLPPRFGEIVFTLRAEGHPMETHTKIQYKGVVYRIMAQVGTKDWLRVWCRPLVGLTWA